jgi:hypothetical protein
VKRCPYCAEDIAEEATRCPYCRSDLTLPAGTDFPGPAPGGSAPATPWSGGGPVQAERVGEGAMSFSHSGERYILGYGPDFFGIWDRTSPGGPVERFPRSNEGWNTAWNRFTAWEPRSVEVPQAGTARPETWRPAEPYKPIHILARWLAGLLVVFAVLAVTSFVLRLLRIQALNRFASGESGASIEASRVRLVATDVFGSLLLIATGVLWLVWQYRAQANLRALGVSGLRFRPGWVVGWWLIPFANIVMPFLTTRELRRASDPAAGAVDWKGSRDTPLLAAWWAAWLARVVFDSLSRVSASVLNPTVHQAIRHQQFAIGLDVATLVAAVLAIFVVREVDARQGKKRERMDNYRAVLVATP